MSIRRYILGRLATSQSSSRYVEGYARYGSEVTLKINGTSYSTSRDTSNGYFKLDIDAAIGQNNDITSLEDFACCDTTGWGDDGEGMLTYVNMSNIGSLAKCTSISQLFYHQGKMNAITLPKIMNLPKCTTAYRAFANLETIENLDLSGISFSNTTADYINLSTFCYNNLMLKTLKLNSFSNLCYFGSIAFANSILENLSFKGSIDCNMRNITDYAGLRLETITTLTSDSITNLVGALANRSLTTGLNVYLSSEVYANVTVGQKAIADDKHWTLTTYA